MENEFLGRAILVNNINATLINTLLRQRRGQKVARWSLKWVPLNWLRKRNLKDKVTRVDQGSSDVYAIKDPTTGSPRGSPRTLAEQGRSPGPWVVEETRAAEANAVAAKKSQAKPVFRQK